MKVIFERRRTKKEKNNLLKLYILIVEISINKAYILYKNMVLLGPVTDEIFTQVSEEFQKPEIQEKIQNILFDPLIGFIYSRVVRYLQFLGLLMALMIILLVTILYLVIKQKN